MLLALVCLSFLFSAFFFLFPFFFPLEQSLVPMKACSGRMQDHFQRFDVYFSTHCKFKLNILCYTEGAGFICFSFCSLLYS